MFNNVIYDDKYPVGNKREIKFKISGIIRELARV